MSKHCSECRWHYTYHEANERTEFKNCFALPYPDCIEFHSMPTAECSFPELFQPKVLAGVDRPEVLGDVPQ